MTDQRRIQNAAVVAAAAASPAEASGKMLHASCRQMMSFQTTAPRTLVHIGIFQVCFIHVLAGTIRISFGAVALCERFGIASTQRIGAVCFYSSLPVISCFQISFRLFLSFADSHTHNTHASASHQTDKRCANSPDFIDCGLMLARMDAEGVHLVETLVNTGVFIDREVRHCLYVCLCVNTLIHMDNQEKPENDFVMFRGNDKKWSNDK